MSGGSVNLIRGRRIWWADWSLADAAKYVEAVKGNCLVPTVYDSRVPARVVARVYSEMNPGVVVMVKSDSEVK